jgi:hypothetical protein
MKGFLGFLNKTYFPQFHTFPVLAKMGHLDLAYTAGGRGRIQEKIQEVRRRGGSPRLEAGGCRTT